MKKIVSYILLALLVVLTPIGMVGCKKSLYGTYKFSNIKITYSKNYSGEKLDSATINSFKDIFKGSYFSINKDGTAVICAEGKVEKGKWEKVGNKLYVYNCDENGEVIEDDPTVLVIYNGRLVIEKISDDGSIKIIYKK